MKVLDKVKKLIEYHKAGLLGGEFMPEDSCPNFAKGEEHSYIYFTLPMALNYQRNSYKLWESTLLTFNDPETAFIYDMNKVLKATEEQLKTALTKYKVALQPNKQPVIWKTLCNTFVRDFGGSIKNFFKTFDNDVVKIKEYMTSHKKDFPYLSGEKIMNYWLFVIFQYTDALLKNKQEITIAPDTHILKASVKLGVISQEDMQKSNIRVLAAARWKALLVGTGIDPIDIHTPFWLWSRKGFKIEI